jgi:hypothetical protein
MKIIRNYYNKQHNINYLITNADSLKKIALSLGLSPKGREMNKFSLSTSGGKGWG